ncbi:aldehyde dehydrogenase family protein [Streptomyces axinellae]|uniref:Aldehyde dehydrogenase family protein n=1 Tax=Streptomyces axinellae TaxID=552788 RepID=A0ABN3PS61_9ACTN
MAEPRVDAPQTGAPRMDAPRRLDALGASGPFSSVNRHQVTAVDGSMLAELSLVPRLFVTRSMAALRRAAPMPTERRVAALARAGELFLGDLDGVPLAEHERQVSRASGVAAPVVRAASRALAHSARSAAASVSAARPGGAVTAWHRIASEGAVWARRGEVFAVHAPANHPGTHTVWLEALALGYRVAVRPSSREPFTPHRLVSALRAAGFGTDQVVLLPTEHALADDLIRAADLSLVYGGDQMARRYASRSDVLVQGPGRSKILLADGAPEDHLSMVVDSVAGHGGTACVNASAVFVQGTRADSDAFARRLAAELATLPPLPPEDESAVLPVLPLARAKELAAHLLAKAGDGELLSGRDLVHELPDGGAVLRPAVIRLNAIDTERTQTEMPFPCVWVAPWSPSSDGLGPLRDTLTLTVVTGEESLVSELVEEPSISNVHVGDRPTHHMAPGLPHDGHLAEFLMRSKTVLRGGAGGVA